MEEILKYVLLLVGNLIAFAGAWFVAFTETDKTTKRKRLTKWGRRALPVAVILLVAGFALTVINDRQSASKAEQAKINEEERNQEIRRLLVESADRDSKISALLAELVSQAADSPSAPSATLVADLAESDVVSKLASDDPDLAAALNQLEVSLGGRNATLQRMKQRGVAVPEPSDRVLVSMHLGLRWFGGSPFQSQIQDIDPITVTAIRSIIRGVDADLVAVTEISDISAFEELVNSIPNYRVVYGARGPGGRMGTAMLYRTDRIQLARQPDTVRGKSYTFPRPPQLLQFVSGDVEFQTVLVHLRSQRGTDQDPRGSVRRETEVREVLDALEKRRELPTLVLGVLNAPSGWMEFDRFRESNARFAGRDLPVDATTFISDRFGPMVLSDFAGLHGFEKAYIKESVEVISLPDLLGASWTTEQITKRISDHNPIVAAFDIGSLPRD